MDYWLCVCDGVDGGWMRRSARTRATGRAARSHACAVPRPYTGGNSTSDASGKARDTGGDAFAVSREASGDVDS